MVMMIMMIKRGVDLIVPTLTNVGAKDKGPFIYDVHTEGEGVRLRWTHVDGGRGSSPMWTSTQKIKIRVH